MRPSPVQSAKVHAAMENVYWAQPGREPITPPGYIFLTTAFEKVGRAMLGELWSGDEGKVATSKQPNGEPAADEARKRGLKVRDQMFEHFVTGAIRTSARRGEDGKMIPVPEMHWNSESDSKLILIARAVG